MLSTHRERHLLTVEGKHPDMGEDAYDTGKIPVPHPVPTI